MASILIVDAPTPFRDAVARTLGRRGHAVRACDAVADAAAALRAGPADLVLLDPGRALAGRAPVTEGSAPWARYTPVLVLTCDAEPAMGAGLDVRGVLVKGTVTLAALAAAVAHALRSSRGAAAAAA